MSDSGPTRENTLSYTRERTSSQAQQPANLRRLEFVFESHGSCIGYNMCLATYIVVFIFVLASV